MFGGDHLTSSDPYARLLPSTIKKTYFHIYNIIMDIYIFRYNLGNSNVNDTNFDKLDRNIVPDVFLVKKHYGEKAVRRRARNWKLKHMAEELHDGISSTNE